ncbi:hypothetical protein E2C01_040559 [Portunus trituberculatus]|uniref:Uncharacterized protein n=1 Tax=Portunus trituberculatus TaxID=210409 RepID=A0A5B7FNJ8_PORTR|nr:hypothetical protein [Portunus trituberculatus]
MIPRRKRKPITLRQFPSDCPPLYSAAARSPSGDTEICQKPQEGTELGGLRGRDMNATLEPSNKRQPFITLLDKPSHSAPPHKPHTAAHRFAPRRSAQPVNKQP